MVRLTERQREIPVSEINFKVVFLFEVSVCRLSFCLRIFKLSLFLAEVLVCVLLKNGFKLSVLCNIWIGNSSSKQSRIEEAVLKKLLPTIYLVPTYL